MAKSNGNMIPSMRYADAPRAIDFLCEAFGFEKHLVVPGDAGTVEHAQLTLGNGMVMLGSNKSGEFDEHLTSPEAAGGVTQSPYVVVPEIEAHYEQAVKAGAEIVMPLEAQDYGGKLYSARDPEGHLWNFGSYDPWAEAP